jgi:hypothetical protein
MNAELVEFTRSALAAGKERQEISDILRRAGWVEPDINAALDAFADITFPIPVPRPKPYLSAREVFVYLILFAAIYAASFSLGALIFELIDRSFPDPLEIQSPNFMRLSDDRIRWDISMIIVAFPLFFLTFRAVTRAVAKDPTKRASRPRKWLTYLTLFVAGMDRRASFECVGSMRGGQPTFHRYQVLLEPIGLRTKASLRNLATYNRL